MEMLLTAIVLWLSSNFGLPASSEHPQIEFVPPSKIMALLYPGFVGQQVDAAASTRLVEREVVSIYKDATKTIYLPTDWTASTPAELSVLVHEVVHHLQNIGGMKFACPQE